MATKDRLLGRISAGATLVVLGGILVVPFLPSRGPGHGEIRHTKVRPAKITPAVTSRSAVRRAETKRDAAVRVQALPPDDARPAAAMPDTIAAKAARTPPLPTQSGPGQPAASAAADPTGGKPVEPVPDVWTEAEQAAGLRECLRLLAPVAAEVTIAPPMKKGACGSPAPVLLHSIDAGGKVALPATPKMNCRLAAGLVRWVETVLQPAAREALGSRITRLVRTGSYSCRNMYSDPKRPLSEHATGNAIDIGGFVTADGRTITVKKGWGPTERDIAAAAKKQQEPAAKARSKARNINEKAEKEDAKSSGADDKRSLHKAGFKTKRDNGPPVVEATGNLTAADTVEAAFLKRLHNGACTVFGTVLGPEANDAHRDHFHFDMKPRRRRSVCH
jgi:hypothetical protein